jgi:hypothetical protein
LNNFAKTGVFQGRIEHLTNQAKASTISKGNIMGTSKNSFLLRTAAISAGGVVRPKCVLDIALAMPAAILTFRQSRENFARSRNKSNF